MADTPGYGEPEIIFKDDVHQFIWLGAGNPADEDGMPSHQYLIIDHDEAYILDPGGYNIFDRVYANVSLFVDPGQIKGLFLSHQDPDVGAGISLWIKKNPRMMVMTSGLWIRFLLHNALDTLPDLLAIPDEGDRVRLPSGSVLQFVPAHYMHAAANFQLYDSRSKILFSGDVGTAVVEVLQRPAVVQDFEQHTEAMVDFHQRYMACNKAVQNYLELVQKLEIECICPQHGAIFKGEDVGRFFDWLGRLDVGVDREL